MTSPNPEQEYMVWAGRFQPFHSGHLSFLTKICRIGVEPVVVAVIASSNRNPVDAYSEEANAQHRSARNPLSVWERVTMIRLCLEAEGLSNRVVPMGIPRPDAHWDTVRSFYPPRRVLCFSDRNRFESMKVQHWRSMGEKVRVIESDLDLSSTLFKETLRSGGDWLKFLPEPTHDYFQRIDGPGRFSLTE